MMYDGRIPDDEQTDCFVAIVSANTCACLMFSNKLFLANVNASFTFAICCCPSVCLSSVTFVRPTEAVQILRNISLALGTLTIH